MEPHTSEVAFLPYFDMSDEDIMHFIHRLVTLHIALPCGFKVGISFNPYSRWYYQYWNEGYRFMLIVDASQRAVDMENMEQYLIEELKGRCQGTNAHCYNIHKGGNGNMRVKNPPPYFTYVVVGFNLSQLQALRAHFDPRAANAISADVHIID